ncbi:MAG: divalent metal cation transporter, partial [Planctomycetota bacterium]
LTSSKAGCQYGYQMLWVLAVASLLMICMTTLGAMLGIYGAKSPCQEIADRCGRPAAVAIGVVLFLIVACFQSSNNVAVIASLDGFARFLLPAADGRQPDFDARGVLKPLALLTLNGTVVAAIYAARSLYRPIEKLMMCLVLVMLVGFTINIVLARPSLTAALRGLAPSAPGGADGEFFPTIVAGEIRDSYWVLQGLIATTLSLAGAFFQAYLVREKKWTRTNMKAGLIDSITGIAVLGGVSALIMITSAAAFYGKVAPAELATASDVARQLEPLFGAKATLLFSLGLFAAAFSSLLGNALIGGTILADSLGRGGTMDGGWSKGLTVLTLALGMSAAVAATAADFETVYLIVFAQALTVLGIP